MAKTGIVLIGMAGVGKSTIGRALARALGRDFIDLDLYLTKKEGRTLQQIIDQRGEDALLRLEEERMREVGLAGRVVSPGGSIIYDQALMASLNQGAWLVYLQDTFTNIEKRLRDAPTRGIVGLKSKTLREVYDERQPLYARYADLTVDVAGKSKQAVVVEIMDFTGSQGISP